MAGFWDNLGQGLQTAGGILSPQVSDQLAQERNLQTQQANRQKELVVQQILSGIQSGSVDAAAGQEALKRLGIANVQGFGPTPEARNAQMQVKLNEQALQGGGLGTPTLGAPPGASVATVPAFGSTPSQPAPPVMPPGASQGTPQPLGAPQQPPMAQPQPGGDGPAVTRYKQFMQWTETPEGKAQANASLTAPRVQAQEARLHSAAEMEMQQQQRAFEQKKDADKAPTVRNNVPVEGKPGYEQDMQWSAQKHDWVPFGAVRPIFKAPAINIHMPTMGNWNQFDGQLDKMLKPVDDAQRQSQEIRGLIATGDPASMQQVQKLLTQYAQQGRMTNQMYGDAKSFGTVYQRFGNAVSRFATGDYSDANKKMILDMVNEMDKTVFEPARKNIGDMAEKRLVNMGVPKDKAKDMAHRPAIWGGAASSDGSASDDELINKYLKK